MTDRDELRQKMAIVIADALGEGIHYQRPGFQRAADAAIAAYEAHRPRADVVLTREEWREAVYRGAQQWAVELGVDWADPIADRDKMFLCTASILSAAFPFVKVEGE